MGKTASFDETEKPSSSSSSPPEIRKVLISGAGICGPVLAFWLAKAGIQVTLLERSESFRPGGHTISLAAPGIEVLELMGLMEQVEKRMTKQIGLKFRNRNNHTRGTFPLNDHGFSFTSDVEIVRSELAKLLYQASLSDRVEYIFGDAIDSIDESEDSIRVSLHNDKSRIMEYDILIVAEGTYSQTRSKVFKEDIRAPLKFFDQWVALFSYKANPDELTERWGTWYHIPNCPSVVVRPDGLGNMRVMILGLRTPEMTETLTTSHVSDETKKEYLINLYQGTGWQSERLVDALRKADDLYFQRVTQTKCPTWSKGRVVLVGDSGYCPSSMTGMGTTVALVGSYVLAGKIVENPSDHKAAFDAYETLLRPPMEAVHTFPPGYPWIGCPESYLGIFLLHLFLRLAGYIQSSRTFSFLCRLKEKLSTPDTLELPEPSIFVEKQSSIVSPIK
jgi:2-polyprenyl-6-methoxyphenol hydroxylase-like FAD-dependent oxidoreductase